MQSVKQHFILFSVEVKLRLLISCIGLRKMSLKEVEQDVKELCQLAMDDDDDWVQAMGAFISTFADRGVMAFDELLKNQYFASTIFSLKTKSTPPQLNFSFQYLSIELNQSFHSALQFWFIWQHVGPLWQVFTVLAR
jgi:hypothetical protein